MAVCAVLFDFNGTLSDDEPLLFAIYAELYAEQGAELTAERYYAELAGHTDEAILAPVARAGRSLERLVDERVRRYGRRVAGGTTVSPAARATVQLAAGNGPVAIVSGAARREIEPVLEASGLRPLVTTLVCGDEVVRGKPDPEGYRTALERLGLEGRAGQALAFEDTEAGVASATAAGVRCIGVAGTLP